MIMCGWYPKTNNNTAKNPPNVGSSVQTPKFIPPSSPMPKVVSIKRKNFTIEREDFAMIYTYKNQYKKVKIYDISYDSTGYPLFLIYINGQWIRKSAKYFKPYE